MLTAIAVDVTAGSETMTMMQVFEVNLSTKAANSELRTSIASKLAPFLRHESLNCLTILETFSKRWSSRCAVRVACEMTRNVARSKSTTSSASQMWQKFSRCASRTETLGTSE
eukprot:Amastigsp_a121_538.p4 type:complete len:113 gc:universal Amastigsp_a121_538:892-554(-)